MTCNGGSKRRERYCTSPRPSNGGKDCPGDGMEVMRCNTKPCAGKADGKRFDNYVLQLIIDELRHEREMNKLCALLRFVCL